MMRVRVSRACLSAWLALLMRMFSSACAASLPESGGTTPGEAAWPPESGGALPAGVAVPAQPLPAPVDPERTLFTRLEAVSVDFHRGIPSAFARAKALVRTAPGFYPGLELYVRMAVATGRVAEARRLFNSRQLQHTPMGRYGAALLAVARGDPVRGEALARQAIDAGCRHPGCFTLFAELEPAEPAGSALMAMTGDGDAVKAGLAWLALAHRLLPDWNRADDTVHALEEAAARLPRNAGWALAREMWGEIQAGPWCRYQPAIAAYREALQVYRARGDRLGERRTLIRLLDVLIEEGSRDVLATTLEEAGALAEASGDPFEVARVLVRRGTFLEDTQYYKEAVAAYEQAIQLQRGRAGQIECAQTLEALGRALRMVDDLPRAQAMYEEGLERIGKDGQPRLRAILLRRLGIVFLDRDRARAERLIREGVSLSRRANDRLNEAKSLAVLGYFITDPSRWSEVIAARFASLELYHQVGRTDYEAMTLTALGVCLFQDGRGDPIRALHLLQRAVDLYGEHEHPSAEGGTLDWLSVVLLSLGEAERAYEIALKSVEILRGVRDGKAALASALRTLGQAALATNRYGEAYAAAVESGEHLRALKDDVHLIMVMVLEAEALEGLGRIAEALLRLREARTIDLQQKQFVYSQTHFGIAIGKILMEQGDLEGARQELTATLELDVASENYDWMLSASDHLARVLGRLGRLQEAADVLDRAIELARTRTTTLSEIEAQSTFFAQLPQVYVGRILLSLSGLAKDEAPDAAMLVHTFGLAETARARSLLLRLSDSPHSQDSVSPIEKERQRAAAHADLERARRFYRGGEPSAEERTALLSWLESDDNAFSPGAVEAYGMAPITPADRAAWSEGLKQQRVPEAALQAVRAAYFVSKERALSNLDASYYGPADGSRVLAEPTTISLEEVQRTLPDATVLFAYLLGEEQSFGWAVTRRTARLFPLPPEEELTRQLQAYRACLETASSSLTELRTRSQALYQLLIGPARDLIARDTALVIVPDGSIGLLPFEALLAPPSHASRSRREPEHWLGLEHIISYAPSATLWCRAQRRPKAAIGAGAMLAVGDPVYHHDTCGGSVRVAKLRGSSRAAQLNEEWDRLCYSEGEIQEIRRSRRQPGGDTADVYLVGEEATESRLLTHDLSRFSILHFSTHGWADDTSPLRSAVVLGQNTAARDDRSLQQGLEGGISDAELLDGYLELREIQRLRLNADLVVLSACDTAKGRTRRGEGVESLARGFLMAGAKDVVASLWSVADESTALFMGRLYRGLENQSLPEALLATRRAMARGELSGLGNWRGRQRRSFTHPFFWAPFVLIEG